MVACAQMPFKIRPSAHAINAPQVREDLGRKGCLCVRTELRKQGTTLQSTDSQMHDAARCVPLGGGSLAQHSQLETCLPHWVDWMAAKHDLKIN